MAEKIEQESGVKQEDTQMVREGEYDGRKAPEEKTEEVQAAGTASR